ncbi:hypothetical protein ACFORO_12445 [Amycolatopsis halotolerans]|uniref:Uncharacterized protein n=1 Tax=Amycolatopsis halotolerans TaxID=330083 RepID=A0ABV7QGH2_9PSEU
MTDQTATEITVTDRAVEDMRDTLLEMGFVGAARAPRENIIRKIDKKFGLEHWLRYYGHAA